MRFGEGGGERLSPPWITGSLDRRERLFFAGRKRRRERGYPVEEEDKWTSSQMSGEGGALSVLGSLDHWIGGEDVVF